MILTRQTRLTGSLDGVEVVSTCWAGRWETAAWSGLLVDRVHADAAGAEAYHAEVCRYLGLTEAVVPRWGDGLTSSEMARRLRVALAALDAEDTAVARGAIADLLTILDLEAL